MKKPVKDCEGDGRPCEEGEKTAVPVDPKSVNSFCLASWENRRVQSTTSPPRPLCARLVLSWSTVTTAVD